MKDSSQHRKLPDLFGTLARGAVFSPCRTWRYTLTRVWDMTVPPAMFIGLNPSTADEVNNDPTVRRCLGFAKQWGYGGLIMTNIFAYRATDPRVMKAAKDPVGLKNDVWLKKMGEEAAIVVAAWGVHGAFGDRGAQVLKLIRGFIVSA